jgi:putative RecB family exonuclease
MDLHELRKQPHLSASAINDYLTCGYLYKLRRIDKVEAEFTSDALELGGVVHEVLAEYHQHRMKGRKLTKKKLLSLFAARWKQAAHEGIEYAEGKDFKTLLAEGKSLLAAYHDGHDDGFKVVGVEQPVRFMIGDIAMLGVIDLMEEDESGALIITDFKTTRKAYGQDDVDNNMQLTIYQMAMKANGYEDREILLKLDCLIKTKKPKFETYYTSRNEIHERRLVKKAMMVWEGVRKGVFIPNDGNWKCNNCEYISYCNEFLEKEEVL